MGTGVYIHIHSHHCRTRSHLATSCSFAIIFPLFTPFYLMQHNELVTINVMLQQCTVLLQTRRKVAHERVCVPCFWVTAFFLSMEKHCIMDAPSHPWKMPQLYFSTEMLTGLYFQKRDICAKQSFSDVQQRFDFHNSPYYPSPRLFWCRTEFRFQNIIVARCPDRNPSKT